MIRSFFLSSWGESVVVCWNQIEAVYSKKNSYVSLLFCLIITSFMICFVKKCFCIAQDHGFTEF